MTPAIGAMPMPRPQVVIAKSSARAVDFVRPAPRSEGKAALAAMVLALLSLAVSLMMVVGDTRGIFPAGLGILALIFACFSVLLSLIRLGRGVGMALIAVALGMVATGVGFGQLDNGKRTGPQSARTPAVAQSQSPAPAVARGPTDDAAPTAAEPAPIPAPGSPVETGEGEPLDRTAAIRLVEETERARRERRAALGVPSTATLVDKRDGVAVQVVTARYGPHNVMSIDGREVLKTKQTVLVFELRINNTRPPRSDDIIWDAQDYGANNVRRVAATDDRGRILDLMSGGPVMPGEGVLSYHRIRPGQSAIDVMSFELPVGDTAFVDLRITASELSGPLFFRIPASRIKGHKP